MRELLNDGLMFADSPVPVSHDHLCDHSLVESWRRAMKWVPLLVLAGLILGRCRLPRLAGWGVALEGYRHFWRWRCH